MMAPLLKCSLLLAFFLTLVPAGSEGKGLMLKRQKREWIIAPRQLKENHDYTGLPSIARIRSDKENFTKILYYLSGPGVDLPPQGVFDIDRNTGFVKIFSILDREKMAFYNLKGVAKYTDGTYAERDIDLNITVVDENDNPPIIKVQQVGFVNESSAAGTVVMRVIATDADQQGTAHSEIHYSIVEQSSTAGMFFINSKTGEVSVRQNTLDREKKDTYTLTIAASDMGGRGGGNTGSGEVTVKILDINDNIPTLEKESYEGSVMENTVNVEVMRVKAIDMDLIHTENWMAVYEIVTGNEAGYFTITTDSKTNEGIITINKALDYEELKMLNLEIAVANKAEYNFGSGRPTGPITAKPYPVKINVLNQKEGPRFQPTIKVVSLSEDHQSVSIHKVIDNYAAIDSDTLQTATNVRYAKNKDADNWLIIDEKTADIKLNKMPDRESKFLINGTYYAEIICISNDIPSKTATGTIAIQVEDLNDECPELTTTTQTLCLEDNVIYVTAIDKDEFPNSAPFQFTVIEGESKGKWTVERLNATTAILRDHANWPGVYKVVMEITDQQGKSCDDVQVMDVTVCSCLENTKTCRPSREKTTELGASGILLLLLGLLLLLLLPLLLLFCLCGGVSALGDFKPIPFDTKQQLISYHTEGQGEDKEVPLMHVPVEAGGATVNAENMNTFDGKVNLGGLIELGAAAGGGAAFGGGMNTLTKENMHMYNTYNSQMGMDYMDGGMMTGQEHLYSRYNAGAFDGMALSEQFLGEYYSSKANHAVNQSQQKDSLLVYDYEGQESLAGSVGCCSLLEDDNDLAFLNDLGPKFKTLASICQGTTLVTESVAAGVSVSPPRPVSPVWPSTSTHTHVSTHTETIRDRDRVNINTLNTSNVASESSTIVQEERITGRAQGSATLPTVRVQDKVVVPSQTLLIQQPTMYYAATPMYVVESKPQMVLVEGGTQQTVGQVGLSQGLVQVGGMQGTQGVVQVGGMQGTQGLVQVSGMQAAPGVVLVDRQVGVGGATGQIAQGLSKGTISRSRQVLLVENGSSGGEQAAHLAQGFVQTGLAEQGLEVRGQGLNVQTQSFLLGSGSSTGSNEDFAVTATPNLQGSQRVVVQRKKVSVTERNVESATRA
ncbi:desmoglein-2-like protein isoform X2 [Centropristis striata]|uniref:desmoglein-2-like protein isoform X2 n=1 Tax=Centropristis striata TaxID=184440 RepID=UPI0027DEE615|nr:desmoglein-2-like protein isoform X2 [Centropristis striata]